MPRNGSGVYSKPSGTTAVANTVIESAKYNSTVDDLVQDANLARPITAGGTGATSAATARTALAVPGTATVNTFTATQTWSKGADVASATALTLGTDGNYFDITGTTTITSIATKGVGTVVKLHFDSALILTHNATDLVLPSGANIMTAAGDEAEFIEYASGDWRCTNYSFAVSGWQTVERRVFSGASSVDFINLAGVKDLRVRGNVTFSVSTDLYWRSSTNNGSGYDAGASDYSNQLFSVVDAATGGARQAAATYAQIGGFASGRIFLEIIDFGSSGQAAVGNARVTAFSSGASSIYIQNTGQIRNDTTARNAIRFGPSGAATMSGEIVVEVSRT